MVDSKNGDGFESPINKPDSRFSFGEAGKKEGEFVSPVTRGDKSEADGHKGGK